ncbi:MAG TPA: membrane protein insertase YidC, partial [Polyangiaceae bacterium]|nr:membrane protein insertase YidC [Polyangiaceae bacterium]
PDHPELSPLFTRLVEKTPGGPAKTENSLVGQDVLDFRLVQQTATSCVFAYEADGARVIKTFESDPKMPYGIRAKLEVTNTAGAPRSYALVTSTSSYLEDHLVENKMFRTNPLHTRVECFGTSGNARRESADDFRADDFGDEERFPKSAHNAGDWSEPSGEAALVAVSNAYFTTALAPQGGPVAPLCQLQIEERWNAAAKNRGSDPHAAAIYKARLVYPTRILSAGQTDTYQIQAFVGPKERKALAAAGDRFDPLIDLGFFSVIAKLLVGFLLAVHGFVHNWGLAIVILTITARLLLFPLSVPSIKNMIQMRELKPEMDKLTERYKDDPQAKSLAQMALWKKHGVNPMKGCLPQLASMPVWFALYTTLQTAVELYNIPFLWFPDLSEPDPFYILPFIIGAVFFVQQKLMPMQSGDPAQQKVMMYLMPGMFTVFMLFLPAGLGVYMFTNSLLGIVQQRAVEAHAKKALADSRPAVVDTEGVGLDSDGKAKRSS